MKKERVIFICSFNSVRSPIAEGVLQQKGGGRYAVVSPGVAPIRVNPFAVRVMQELKIVSQTTNLHHCTGNRNENFDYAITLCDNARSVAEEMLPNSDRFFHRNFVTPRKLGEHGMKPSRISGNCGMRLHCGLLKFFQKFHLIRIYPHGKV